MANLISDATRLIATGKLSDHFDTFSINMTVFREGKKTVTTVNQGSRMYGYGNQQSKTNTTFIPDTGTNFQALLSIREDQQLAENLGEAPIRVDDGLVKVEVQKDARDFINEKKVEKIDIDGKTCNLDGEDVPRTFLGLTYYVFNLRPTK